MTPRDHLLDLVRTLPHRTWALTHPVDARKITNELAGRRRPQPGSGYARAIVGLARAHPPPPPAPTLPATVFARLGTLFSRATEFHPGKPAGAAFLAAGGAWVACQYNDPATHDSNMQAYANGWAGNWRQAGVTVLGWHRINHPWLPGGRPSLDGWVFNSEEPAENTELTVQATAYRSQHPGQPLAVATLGRQLEFPTGLLGQLDMHLLPECFPEEGTSDDTVAGSVDFWVRSGVARSRIHPMVLFSDSVQRLPHVHAQETRALGLQGMSAFVGENTPPAAWAVMA